VLRPRQFASDNVSGICPEAMAALAEANRDHAPSYGADAWTARAEAAIRDLLGAPDAEVFLLFTGTAANALSLAALAPPFGVAYCHPVAHVANDECGAPQMLGHGLQLRTVGGAGGKVDPARLRERVGHEFLHSGKPAALTLTQATELGTVYSLGELRALRDAARDLGLKVHMDGARLANAIAALGARPRDVVEAAGLTALSLGGTKNGLLAAEAVVLFDREAARDFAYRRKQAGQLASKHRYLAAQWVGVLESGAWLRNAERANRVAAALEAGARRLGLEPVHPREANEVFLPLPDAALKGLEARGWAVYSDAAWGGARLVASWDSTDDDVRAFLDDLAAVLA